MNSSSLKKIQGVCLDIDETLSTRGKLTAEAYQSLWKLKDAGFQVIPITGRPAGWCDQIARFWPVDAVVGENGAFTFFMQNRVRKRIDTPSGLKPGEQTAKLKQLSEKIKKEFSHAIWASDQSYREFDLAVDICEDVKPWSEVDVARLLEFCKNEKAHAKLSSIHVNIWFGDYDKKKGFENWRSYSGSKLQLENWIFIGDSPNDEPLFEFFPTSVGVANLKKYLPQLKHKPTWITQAESGAGFTELAEQLIQSR